MDCVGEAQQNKSVVHKVVKGEVQLLYITPENIVKNEFYRNMLTSKKYRENLVALVVDEAHCIKLWGEHFRQTFSEIGNIRSILPTGVNVMALTATATSETYYCALNQLAMIDPVLVALPPDRRNIKYSVKPATTLEKLSDELSGQLKDLNNPFPKTVLFVRRYQDCSNLYAFLHHKVGEALTDPPGYPNVAEYRRVEMYHRILPTQQKAQILATFGRKDCKLKLIIATTAFGLGVDCADIRQVIHWGVPNTVEEYVQESGRSGRDTNFAEAILFQGKVGVHCTKLMKDYTFSQDTCRRRMLFSSFLSFSGGNADEPCKCCDICKMSCQCANCSS